MKKALIVGLLLSLCFVFCVASEEDSSIASDSDVRRAELWMEFGKALPKDVTWRSITVYAENPSLTQVCFRADGGTYIFDLTAKKTDRVVHAASLPDGSVNSITFYKSKDSSAGSFILWSNGRRQLSIAARE